MKIVFIIGQMLCGGAEHVVLNLVKKLHEANIKIKLVILGEIDFEVFPEIVLIDYIQYSDQYTGSRVSANFKKLKFIRKQVTTFKADLVLSFIDATNVLTILATRGLGIPVIISERNHPDRSKMSQIWFYLRHFSYPFAQALVVANEGLKALCKYKKFNRHIEIIPNLMKFFEEDRPIVREKNIIMVGSLTPQKRFDLLIEAVHLLTQKSAWPDYRVNIYGEGHLRSFLQDKIDEYGLSDVIHLRGQSNHIHLEYQRASIFVLCSDYEGQPNVLLEAMHAGLACIATDCDFGPNEIISNHEDGRLIPVKDVNVLASTLLELIQNEALRTKLGSNAAHKIKQNFSPDIIFKKWFVLFNRLTYKK